MVSSRVTQVLLDQRLLFDPISTTKKSQPRTINSRAQGPVHEPHQPCALSFMSEGCSLTFIPRFPSRGSSSGARVRMGAVAAQKNHLVPSALSPLLLLNSKVDFDLCGFALVVTNTRGEAASSRIGLQLRPEGGQRSARRAVAQARAPPSPRPSVPFPAPHPGRLLSSTRTSDIVGVG